MKLLQNCKLATIVSFSRVSSQGNVFGPVCRSICLWTLSRLNHLTMQTPNLVEGVYLDNIWDDFDTQGHQVIKRDFWGCRDVSCHDVTPQVLGLSCKNTDKECMTREGHQCSGVFISYYKWLQQPRLIEKKRKSNLIGHTQTMKMMFFAAQFTRTFGVRVITWHLVASLVDIFSSIQVFTPIHFQSL